jgi:hypothetical protein
MSAQETRAFSGEQGIGSPQKNAAMDDFASGLLIAFDRTPRSAVRG